MKLKKTLLFYFSMGILIVGFPAGLYGLSLPGGAALGGVLVLLFVFFTVGVLIAEQLLFYVIKPNKYLAVVIDIGMIVGLVIWYLPRLA